MLTARPLTARQIDMLLFIDACAKATGIGPSFDEMTTGIGIKSKSNICDFLDALEAHGYIRRLHFRARAIEITPRGKAYLAEPAQMARAA